MDVVAVTVTVWVGGSNPELGVDVGSGIPGLKLGSRGSA
jgi:hypothetical protein